MKKFEFSIVASGLDPQADDFEDRFYDAGCDDATISFQKGHIIVDFAREAETVDEAISSAIDNVQTAGAVIERIEPDPLVSLSDIATRAEMSRSAMSLYAQGKRGRDFPAPVARVTSESPLWNWSEVAKWLFVQKRISRDTAIEAEAFFRANEAIVFGHPPSRDRLHKQVEEYACAL